MRTHSTPSRVPKMPPLLRGSLITLRRRCGKPNCHCAHGTPHATLALSYSQQGQTRILTLPPDCRPQVLAALQRYQQAQAQLARQADAALRQFARYLQYRKQRLSPR